ncbi:MAG: DEAD/DEAH box helicase family protein, partial [Verrucomicrobiae bacterium]|nr:DEAD/DEAH box helicase family protein [Verrucomicrobiae bacterium]
MIARVVLDLSLRREFDYLIPETLADRVEVGARVRVPFGAGSRLGVVVAVAETSEHPALKPIEKVLGEQSLLTPNILALARWMAGYYCCSVEAALKSVLPEAVRKEEAGWRERLYVHALPPERSGGPELTARQQAVWNVIEEWRELPLQELVRLAETTPETVRKLEDKGYVVIAPRREERDPYAHERFVPTTPLVPNPEQQIALEALREALNRPALAQEPAAPFLLHGVTGSGKTEVYLQVLESALAQGRGGIVLVPEISLTPQTVERFKARFSSGRHRTLVAVLHSQLGAGERHDEWHKIRQGRARIVIG